MLGRIASAATARMANMPRIITRSRVTTAAAFGAGAVFAMPAIAGEDFFEHKFITRKDPDDIIDFYSTEDFLEILGVFKFALHFILNGVEWDKERENTMNVYNAMEISFQITEEEGVTADGEKCVAFFQKRERFKNFIPLTPFLMWDQTQRYGYNRMEDGTIEIFHRGEHFTGPLIARWLIMAHARYVIWATERHINSPAFGNGNLEEQHEQRSNIPMHVFSDFCARLAIAQRIAIESGKIAAGASTEDAQKTLKTLEKLQRSPSSTYVAQLRKHHLVRRTTSVVVNEPTAQAAIQSALANLSKTNDGQTAVKAAMEEVMSAEERNRPEVEKTGKKYGGAFQGLKLKNYASAA